MQTIRRLLVSAVLAATTLSACADSATKPTSAQWNGTCDLAAEITGATTFTVGGACDFAQLGHMQMTEIHTISPTATGGTFVSTATYTASNGDQLHTTNTASYTNTASGLTVTGTEKAVGGTGRFKNASGSASITGTVQFTGATSAIADYAYNGQISY